MWLIYKHTEGFGITCVCPIVGGAEQMSKEYQRCNVCLIQNDGVLSLKKKINGHERRKGIGYNSG